MGQTCVMFCSQLAKSGFLQPKGTSLGLSVWHKPSSSFWQSKGSSGTLQGEHRERGDAFCWWYRQRPCKGLPLTLLLQAWGCHPGAGLPGSTRRAAGDEEPPAPRQPHGAAGHQGQLPDRLDLCHRCVGLCPLPSLGSLSCGLSLLWGWGGQSLPGGEVLLPCLPLPKAG